MLPARLRRLPERRDPRGARVLVAGSFRSRLLGLALLSEFPTDTALLLPGCSAVHTVGMRFAVDVAFLDRHGRVLQVDRGVPPCRFLRCRGAAQVLEWRSPG